ncbi:MAG: HmuY family protein [Gemmatimonadetes bacterium]|nr:HmuY family protein [Gemmatimonadota bacterium]
MSQPRKPLGLYVAAGVFLLTIVAVVASSFRRSTPPGYLPTTPNPRPVGETLVSDTITVDARDGSRWARFDFDLESVVDDDAEGWDLAFNRFHIVTNGGPLYAGDGGALAVQTSWDSVTEAPDGDYTTTDGRLADGAVTPALERWYEYSFFAHTLEPKDQVYVIRSAEGMYAKLRILSYYCPEATPGCVTFEYVFQGDGSRRLTS